MKYFFKGKVIVPEYYITPDYDLLILMMHKPTRTFLL